MLGVGSYSIDYINHCRINIQAQLQAYERMIAANSSPAFEEARGYFESHFFTNLLLVLENYFVHRLRGKEKKDGNPLNEVRLLSASLMNNHGILAADKTIDYKREKAVLKLAIGQQIKINHQDFINLSEAFLQEIELKYRE